MENFITLEFFIVDMINLLECQRSLAKSFSRERTPRIESNEEECEIVKFVKKQQRRRRELSSLVVEILETEIAQWKEELDKVRLHDEHIYGQLVGGNKERFIQNMKVLLDDEKIDFPSENNE